MALPYQLIQIDSFVDLVTALIAGQSALVEGISESQIYWDTRTDLCVLRNLYQMQIK